MPSLEGLADALQFAQCLGLRERMAKRVAGALPQAVFGGVSLVLQPALPFGGSIVELPPGLGQFGLQLGAARLQRPGRLARRGIPCRRTVRGQS